MTGSDFAQSRRLGLAVGRAAADGVGDELSAAAVEALKIVAIADAAADTATDFSAVVAVASCIEAMD